MSIKSIYYFGARSENSEAFLLIDEVALSLAQLHSFSRVCQSTPQIKVLFDEGIVFDRDRTIKNFLRRLNKFSTKQEHPRIISPQKQHYNFVSLGFYRNDNLIKPVPLPSVTLNPIKYTQRDDDDRVNVIVVLGNGDSLIRAHRINRALEVFNTLPSYYKNSVLNHNEITTYLLFSGGTPREKSTSNEVSKNEFELSEAELMQEYALTRGLKQKHIILEPKSLNTVQNIIYTERFVRNLFSTKLMYRYHWVTSASHLKRVCYLVEKLILWDESYFYGTDESISAKQRKIEKEALEKLKDHFGG